jgi:hypothetical protein
MVNLCKLVTISSVVYAKILVAMNFIISSTTRLRKNLDRTVAEGVSIVFNDMCT